MSDWLLREHGIVCLGSLGFENAYALAMRKDRAKSLGVQTISELAPRAPRLSIGGDYEFFVRPEWKALREQYELSFAAQRSFDSTLMYSAVQRGVVDVISAFTTDGRIPAFELVLLRDDREVLPPYDAVLLLSPRAARNRRLKMAFEPLIGANQQRGHATGEHVGGFEEVVDFAGLRLVSCPGRRREETVALQGWTRRRQWTKAR